MGYGNYSHSAHAALLADRAAQPGQEVFTQRGVHALMDPRGLRVRESRDNADHPNSLPVVFALMSPARWATFRSCWRARSCRPS